MPKYATHFYYDFWGWHLTQLRKGHKLGAIDYSRLEQVHVNARDKHGILDLLI
jgi:hypothetical protein